VDDLDAIGGLDAQIVQVGVVVDLNVGDGLSLGLAGGGVGGKDLVAGLEAGDEGGLAVGQENSGTGGEAATGEISNVVDWSAANCSRSTAFSAAYSAIRASRPASRSRSRAFAARSPSSPLSGTPGTSGTAERCHDANQQTSKQAQLARKRRQRQERPQQTYLVTARTTVASVSSPRLQRRKDHPWA
jgi:hypothetical protein